MRALVLGEEKLQRVKYTMRWPKDLGEWGFILSLLALLLMYPVGLIVNISSPKLQDWFAGWSKDRLLARIDKLQTTRQWIKTFRSWPSSIRFNLGRLPRLVLPNRHSHSSPCRHGVFVYRDIRPSSSSFSTESFFLSTLFLNILFTVVVTAQIRKRYRVF